MTNFNSRFKTNMPNQDPNAEKINEIINKIDI